MRVFFVSLLIVSVACGADGWGGYDGLYKEAQELQGWALNVRRLLHQLPELMYQEVNTSKTIQQHLTDMGIKFSTGWGVNKHKLKKNPYRPPSPKDRDDPLKAEGGTGIVAEIGSGHSPCVLLRADIDALPVEEKALINFKSRNNGKMHACGHDAHITMLLMAAKILKKHEKSLNGTVRLMFQPAEEGGAGAKMMVDEGVLTKDPAATRLVR
eukprot:GHVN01040035.1.p1 GENE.GHVN01040035.1~~GHVN01040035.1.p1  ORF type:complete len:212 (+),score=41.72 GHVN01040035.1:84-719(+)